MKLSTLGLSAILLFSSWAVAADAAKSPTFTKDVAPIFQDKCESCHRPNNMAPMPLITYEDARPWARAMKTKTGLRGQRGSMPPWGIEKDIGIQQFKNDRSLTEDEIAAIAKWADSGAVFHWREADDTNKKGLTAWSIFPAETKYFDPSRAPFMLNYRVEDLDGLLKALAEEGVEIDPKREDHDYGRFAWIMDPDGNRIELWEPPKDE